MERNTIRHNGFGDVDPVNGVPYDLDGGVQVRVLQTGREGIAIDGSRNNRVVNNVIHSNAAGGIFLYKNCGEYATQKPNQWWQRYYGADGNEIDGNIIVNEPQGIWIGSRMAEDQYFMDCSDPAYCLGPPSSDPSRLREEQRRAQQHARSRSATLSASRTTAPRSRTTRSARTTPRHAASSSARSCAPSSSVNPSTTPRSSGNTVTMPNAAAAYGWVHGQTNTTFGPNLVERRARDLDRGYAADDQPLAVRRSGLGSLTRQLGRHRTISDNLAPVWQTRSRPLGMASIRIADLIEPRAHRRATGRTWSSPRRSTSTSTRPS